MAVSGSTDFASTAVELISDARRVIGIHAEEEPLANHEAETGRRILTKMLKAWEADGVGSWILTEGTMALVSGDRDYVFGPGGSFVTVPFEITQMRVSRDGGSEIEMMQLSRESYYRLPNRSTQGFPTQFFYDRQRDNGTLYVWSAPDSNDYDVTFTYRRRIMDIDANTDNFDLPPEWEHAITYNLAKLMLPIYGRSGSPQAKDIQVEAATSYLGVKAFDTGVDDGSVMIERDPYERSYR